MKKRIVCLLLALVMLLPLFLQRTATPAEAAKKEPKRAIAVVFDNSGSMYYPSAWGSYDPRAWCRATYAMEVFASMLNEGDVMQIHPMNEATLGGSGTKYVYGSNPLVITKKDAQKIRQFQVHKDGNTPIESINAAYQSLMKMDADEKFLIVLTDGATFTYTAADGTELSFSKEETKTRVTEELSKCTGIKNVMYLGIGDAIEPGQVSMEHHFAVAKNSASVTAQLTEMCNLIFGRDLLPAANIKDGKVELDVSMKTMIVFAQGAGVSEVKLNGQSGQSVAVKYSEKGVADGTKTLTDPGLSLVDDTLQGVIATFTGVKAGTYTLDVEGDYEIYYEPDVDLKLQFTNAAGEPVDAQQCYAEKYTLSWFMVDNQTGQPTNSALLGKVDYSKLVVSVTHKDGTVTNYKASDYSGNQVELELKAGDNVTGTFEVTYLGDYTSTSTTNDLGWGANGLDIQTRQVGAVELRVTGGNSTYKLSTFEEEAVYQLTYYEDGNKITGDALKRADEPTVQISGGNAQYELEKNDDGWALYLKYNGKPADTTCGEQTVMVSGRYTNEDEQSAEASGSVTYTLEDDSHGLAVEVSVEDDYYVLSQLENAPPVVVQLTSEGAFLTESHFETMVVTVTIDGLRKDVHYTVEPDKENSRYLIRFVPGSDIPTEDFEVEVRVKGQDEFGREQNGNGKVEVGFHGMPLWLKVLIILLAIALVAFLIWAYLNTKVLPNEIRAGQCNFRVDGERVTGDAYVRLNSNKKRGTIEIRSPSCMTNPMAKCILTLEVEAISPRHNKSATRKVRVVGVSTSNSTSSLAVNTFRMSKDRLTGKMVKVGGKVDAPIDFTIGNNCPIVISATVMDAVNGGDTNCTLNVPLKFY